VFGTDYDTPDGTGVRDFIHVTDLAKGHTAALRAQSDKDKPLTGYVAINLGTGRGTSVLELVSAFERASGIKIEKKFTDRRPGDVTKLVAKPSLAKELLDWETELTIDDMCRDSWNWVHRNPNGYQGAKDEDKKEDDK
jgi:UDP-glucose 4-epimerase